MQSCARTINTIEAKPVGVYHNLSHYSVVGRRHNCGFTTVTAAIAAAPPPPQTSNNMSAVHEFKVEMTCEGCSGAVERVLGKLGDKIDKLDIDLAGRKVYVSSSLSADELLEVIKKTGKETTYIGLKQQ